MTGNNSEIEKLDENDHHKFSVVKYMARWSFSQAHS